MLLCCYLLCAAFTLLIMNNDNVLKKNIETIFSGNIIEYENASVNSQASSTLNMNIWRRLAVELFSSVVVLSFLLLIHPFHFRCQHVFCIYLLINIGVFFLFLDQVATVYLHSTWSWNEINLFSTLLFLTSYLIYYQWLICRNFSLIDISTRN